MSRKNTQTKSAEIIIVGGGLAGFAAALGIVRAGFSVIHLAPDAAPDKRTSALMMPSVQFLQQLGVVASPPAFGTPLTHIRIIDATQRLIRAPETCFASTEAGFDAFGWNFANSDLMQAFQSACEAEESYHRRREKFLGHEQTADGYAVALETGDQLVCKMLVGADGKMSPVRQAAHIAVKEHKFQQSALVCDLKLGRGIGGESVEFHYPQGPFTLVPAGNDIANLVWIDDDALLQHMRQKPQEELETILAAKAKQLFGPIEMRSKAFVFPLSSLSAQTAATDGVVLVGEAAHAFPPIGAQGLNLSLRDVRDLVTALQASDQTHSNWAVTAASEYERTRQRDLTQTSGMVNTLFRSLLEDMLPAQMLRAGGLWALKGLPFLRKKAFEAGMGLR